MPVITGGTPSAGRVNGTGSSFADAGSGARCAGRRHRLLLGRWPWVVDGIFLHVVTLRARQPSCASLAATGGAGGRLIRTTGAVTFRRQHGRLPVSRAANRRDTGRWIGVPPTAPEVSSTNRPPIVAVSETS